MVSLMPRTAPIHPQETQCSCSFLIGGVDSAVNGSEILKDESWSMLEKNTYLAKLVDPRRN